MTFIIKSEDTIIVPDLMGKNVVYALETLTALGLNTKVKGSEYSRVTPKNHIIFQEPAPGVEIKKGRDIRVIISKGAQTVSMPDLTGLLVQKGRIALMENGLCQGTLSRTTTDTIEKDKIIAQFPSPGMMIEHGVCVDLLVSSGIRPKAYQMPELIGLSFDDAMGYIENRNLRIGEIKSVFYGNRTKNTVMAQNPWPGHRVIEDDAVDLTINRKPDKNEPDYLLGAPGIGLFRHRVGHGFLRKRIRVQLDCYGASINIFNEFVKPGEEVWLLIPRDEDATVYLYEDETLLKQKTY